MFSWLLTVTVNFFDEFLNTVGHNIFLQKVRSHLCSSFRKVIYDEASILEKGLGIRPRPTRSISRQWIIAGINNVFDSRTVCREWDMNSSIFAHSASNVCYASSRYGVQSLGISAFESTCQDTRDNDGRHIDDHGRGDRDQGSAISMSRNFTFVCWSWSDCNIVWILPIIRSLEY